MAKLREAVWHEPPLSRFEPDPDDLDRVIDRCALRFDGYRYREEHPADYVAMIEQMESEGDYDQYDTHEKLVAFFLLQRGLRKWGSVRAPETSSERRVYRELFLALYDVHVPRAWAQPHAAAYDEWRWGLRPVCAPYVSIADRQLETLDYQ